MPRSRFLTSILELTDIRVGPARLRSLAPSAPASRGWIRGFTPAHDGSCGLVLFLAAAAINLWMDNSSAFFRRREHRVLPFRRVKICARNSFDALRSPAFRPSMRLQTLVDSATSASCEVRWEIQMLGASPRFARASSRRLAQRFYNPLLGSRMPRASRQTVPIRGGDCLIRVRGGVRRHRPRQVDSGSRRIERNLR